MNYTPALRWAILSIVELIALYGLTIWFQSSRPFWVGVRIATPFYVAALLPYLYVAWRLMASPADPRGLRLAFAIAVAITLLIAASFLLLISLSPFVAIVALPTYLVLGVFVATQWQLMKVTSSAISAGRGFGAALAATALPAIGLTIVMFVLTVALLGYAEHVSRRTSFSSELADKHMLNVFNCLWAKAGPGARNGFPATEAEVRAMGLKCWNPEIAPDGPKEGSAYDFIYMSSPPDPEGKVRGFTVATKQRVFRGPTQSHSIDHLGVMRRSSTGWPTEKDRVLYASNFTVTKFMGMCDAYRELTGAYPHRLAKLPYGTPAPPGVMRMTQSVEEGRDGWIVVVESAGGSLLSYRPNTAGDEKPTTYRLSYRAKRRKLSDVRSYFVDSDGSIHATPEDRDATPNDPTIPSDAFAPDRAEARRWALAFFKEADGAAPE